MARNNTTQPVPNPRGGRPKGYKMSRETKEKLRAAWRRRKGLLPATAPVPESTVLTRFVSLPITSAAVTVQNGKAEVRVSDRAEAVEMIETLIRFLA